jgi:hypothetical protein
LRAWVDIGGGRMRSKEETANGSDQKIRTVVRAKSRRR